MVPAAIKLLRSCGILAVFGSLAVWLGNSILVLGGDVVKGVMSTGFIVGGPATVAMMPWALDRSSVRNGRQPGDRFLGDRGHGRRRYMNPHSRLEVNSNLFP